MNSNSNYSNEKDITEPEVKHPTGFAANLAFLRGLNEEHSTQASFAHFLDISQGYVSQLLSGRTPSAGIIDRICYLYGCRPDELTAPDRRFIDGFFDRRERSDLFNALFPSAHQRVPNLRQKYRGVYSFYYQATKEAPADDHTYVGSLISFETVGRFGLRLRIVNPQRVSPGEYQAFEYEGWLVQTDRFANVFARRINSGDDLWHFVFPIGLSSVEPMFDGVMIGAGVTNDRAYASAARVVGVRSKVDISDWRMRLGLEIGYLKFGELPKSVQTRLRDRDALIAVGLSPKQSTSDL